MNQFMFPKCNMVFRWYEEVALLKVAQFWATAQLKQITRGQPVHQVCIPVSWWRWGSNWDLLGFFGSIWVEDNMQGRKMSSLNFWVLWKGLKIWDTVAQIAPYLRKYKYLVKEVYWRNVGYCLGVLSWSMILNIFERGFRQGQRQGCNIRFYESIQNSYLAKGGFIYICILACNCKMFCLFGYISNEKWGV